MPVGELSPASANVAVDYSLNCKLAERRILEELLYYSKYVEHSKEGNDSVCRIVRLAGELALEFGAQRYGMGLTLLKMGDIIQLGEEFVDCLGLLKSGTDVTPRLVVSPSMVKIGDGGSDLQSRRIIIPGRVYV